MTIYEILFLLVIFIANIFEAMTGFAGTLLAMPFSMLLIGINEAKTILNILALIACFYITITNLKHINKQEFFKITVFMLVGLAIGMMLFQKLALGYLLNIYAVVIILIALKNMFIKKSIVKIPFMVTIVILLLAGVIHGMFLSGGSLLVIYAMTTLKGKSEFRATLAAIWVVLDIGMIINQLRLGYVTSEVLTLTSIALIPLFFAIVIGNFFHKYIKQELFLKITYVLLLISGVSLLVN
ncbi:sulfite exporter TauE/SafE family protein [Planococcus faecalis]|uniref:Probable membrane transporter protein n=1 Tax=Planococcus faecalis TaxID=1598147 RepID=A0ABN4XPX5_9BACL|nr:sulfite exporter TauE/SafE family protein [Planococcus faecalis]AQU80850.1 hypothetical protein AJGP001_16825 [Planococcus faecalis]OHX55831.1 hypothetical protein BB777_01405 [Planococcus faecalis]